MWVENRVGELLCTPLRNGVYKPAPFHGRGVRIVNMGELFAHPRIPDVEMRRLELSEHELAKSGLKKFDLLFARRSLVAEGAGKCSIVAECNEPTTFESSIIRGRIDPEKADPRYIFYYFASEEGRDRMGTLLRQTAVSGITGTDLHDLFIPVPPTTYQRRVADLLWSIDDRIALNEKLNAALEATAAAVFKSWFVDFDPVVAKSEGRKPFGMTDEIAALFPDRFAPSGLPEGWNFDSLDGIAHYKNGLAMQKYPPNASGSLPVIKIAELRAGSPVGADEAAANIPSDVIIDDGDVVFSWSGTLLVKIWCGGKGALNQHLFKVTSGQYPKWFYYWWTREHLADFIEIADDKKTTMGHIKRHHLTDAKVAVPSPELLSAADGVFGPLLDRVILNEKQNRALRNLRDAILPGLVSGELQIKDVQEELQPKLKVPKGTLTIGELQGSWPGNETDEEIEDMLKELRK